MQCLLLGVSQSAYNNLWQSYSDNMEWAWTSAENERARISRLAEIKLQADSSFNVLKYKSDANACRFWKINWNNIYS